jgi:hypothetical protein
VGPNPQAKRLRPDLDGLDQRWSRRGGRSLQRRAALGETPRGSSGGFRVRREARSRRAAAASSLHPCRARAALGAAGVAPE